MDLPGRKTFLFALIAANKVPHEPRGPGFPISGLERQRHPAIWADGHRDPRRVWIGSNAGAIRITADRNHTNGALAEWGTILEIRRDPVDFSDRWLRVVHESNHNLFFSIADIQDLEMVDAVSGTLCRASRHWAVVVRPIRCYVRGQTMAEKNSP